MLTQMLGWASPGRGVVSGRSGPRVQNRREEGWGVWAWGLWEQHLEPKGRK